MPNIKTFDAGDLQLRPSDAGSAAYRELGGVASRAARTIGEEERQAGRAIGQGIASFGNVIERAQAHTDAMAEIDFQRQLTQAEIAAQGGVNVAGSPKDADGTPIFDNPGRGVDKSLPPDASAPSPDQYAVAASNTLENHGTFLDNLIGRFTGTNVSQKAIDRMNLQAAASNRRLELHANAVAGEVAFTHATHTTEQTINETLAGVRRGDVPLDSAMDHIDGALGALGGSLSGSFSAKGAPFIENTRTRARQQAIVASIEGDLAAGRTDNALRTLNDPKWDKDIGGVRDKIEREVDSFRNAQVRQQETQRRLDQEKQKDAALARTDQYVQDAASPNPKFRMQDIWTDPAYAGRPDLRKEAVGVFETMRKADAQDISVSPLLSHTTTLDLMKRMTAEDGDPTKITDRRAIDQAFINQQINKQDYQFALREFAQINKSEGVPIAKTREDFFKNYAATIDPSRDLSAGGYGASALGNQNLYRAKQEAIRQEQDLIKQGKDPASLYDPSSPNFFGRPANIMRFHTSLQDQQNFNKEVEKTGTFTQPSQIIDDTAKFGVGYNYGKIDKVQALIIHHTGGEGDVNGVISTLQQRHLGAQYVIDRQGRVHQLMPDGAEGRQIIPGSGKGEGLSNRNTIGVEVIAKDDKDVLPVQVEAAKRLATQLGQKYGFDPKTETFGHGEVNPGHKEADEGATITRAIRGETTQQAALPKGFPSDARLAPDGKYYVQRDGRYYRVEGGG